ncbi:hypothetical protein GPN2_20138 [Streptomyces murinus]
MSLIVADGAVVRLSVRTHLAAGRSGSASPGRPIQPRLPAASRPGSRMPALPPARGPWRRRGQDSNLRGP